MMCSDGKSRWCLVTLALIAFSFCWAFRSESGLALAAEAARPEPTAAATGAEWQPPPYPRVTLSTCYEVDPDWPRRPENVLWGRTPGIAVDDKDQVWVFTRAYPPVQVYTTGGKFVRAWGDDLITMTPKGLGSHQIEIDGRGHVWLVDAPGNVVMECTPDGKLLRTLGTRGEAGCDETHFDRPTDVAIAPDGQVFVTDGYGNARVVHFDAAGEFVKAWGKLGTGPGEFSIPHSIVLDSKGQIYVADRNNARVQVFDQNGRFLDQWQNLLVPWGLWISAEDEIWVCGSSPMGWREEDDNLGCPPKDQLFMKFDTTGRLLQLWTAPKGVDDEEKPGELNWVHGIALDSQGNIYVGDIMGERAQKFVRQK